MICLFFDYFSECDIGILENSLESPGVMDLAGIIRTFLRPCIWLVSSPWELVLLVEEISKKTSEGPCCVSSARILESIELI